MINELINKRQFIQHSFKLLNLSKNACILKNVSCISSHFVKNTSNDNLLLYQNKCNSINNLINRRNNEFLLNVNINLINYNLYRNFKASGKSINLADNEKKTESSNEDPLASISSKELSLFEKFKLMYKQYWYILVPVHLITSLGWFAGFYYIVQSGVDVPGLLQSLHFSDTIIDKFKNSQAGNAAICYLMYKIATPLRYTVTLGGTTWAIRYLSKKGLIKPVPTKNELQQMYKDKKMDMTKKK